MINNDRPRTLDELSELPEAGGFGSEERVINGKTWIVPVAPEFVSFWSEFSDINHWIDADGARWKLRRYADGRWCKQRVYV